MAPVVVIGAGAAGLTAAIFAGRAAPSGGVVLLERTRDGGRKILVSGGGRCNVLPRILEPERFVTDSSPNSLRKMLLAWPLAEQKAFFENEADVPLALEGETGKYFPRSGRARDVRDALFRLAAEAGVEVRFGARLIGLRPAAPGWSMEIEGQPELRAQSVVVATGGLSLPGTGSDGVGLDVLAALGHAVHPLYPALTPLLANPAPHAHLAGLSRDVTLRAPGAGSGGKALVSTGGFLFTHRGYSGPAVLDLSHLAVRSRGSASPQRLEAQWTALDEAAWDELLRAQSGFVGPLLERHLQTRLAETLLAESGIEPRQPLHRLRREDRLALIGRLVRYPLPWTGDEGYPKAEVTGGGVALAEVHPQTLESRRCPGLYLCGELLDAFGPIGGHNFSWAWATGRAAGRAVGAAAAQATA